MSTLDEWIKSDSSNPVKKEEPITPKKTEKKTAYVLPTGAVSIYFREGKGFIFHYDARAYKEEHEESNKALLTNLDILSIIWNKLIEMNYSPRYLSKAYDDDIYVIVLANVDKEIDDYMEVDKLRIHVSKHPLDAKIRDLSEWTPLIPNEIEKKMSDRNIDFKNPMLKYQETLSKLKSQEEKPEKPIEQEPTIEKCGRYTVEYIKQLLESDPYIYDPRFQRIWDMSEITYAYTHNDWHTNSGHFNAIMKRFAECWKKNSDMWDFNKKLLPIIHQYKDKHLRELMKYWEKDLKKHIDNTKEFAKSRNIKYTEIWRQHAIDTWRELNLIREELKLSLLPIPEILNYSTREIIIKVLSESDENILDKYTEPTKDDEKSEPTGEESLEEEKNKIREIFKKENLYRPELEEDIEEIAKGELNLDTILSIERRRITPITNEDIKHAIEEAVFHVGNYIPETTKKIYREKSREEAIKFLKQHIRDYGFGGPGELTIHGRNDGILIQTDPMNPPYKRLIKYSEVLNYILYHTKPLPEKPKEKQPEKKFICELCGKKTNKLHQLKNGPLYELLPDKRVCWQCYVKEHRKLYEKYGVCPECNARIHLKEWPDFECDNGHVININSIEIDTKKMLDDIYGKVSPEKYKELHDKLYTVKDAIEEKYNKHVHGVHLATVNKSLTGVAYISITTLPIKELKEKIKEEEGLFAGLSVMFKNDFGNETWMNKDLLTVDKPELVKKAEKYLDRITKKIIQEQKKEDKTPLHSTTPLDSWTKEGDSND